MARCLFIDGSFLFSPSCGKCSLHLKVVNSRLNGGQIPLSSGQERGSLILTRYRNCLPHRFPMPGKARLRGGSHALLHARQSTGVYAQALLLTPDPVAMPDERLEVKKAAPDQLKSSRPRRRRSDASSSQTWRPVKLPCTRL